jgi:DnaJ-class molecular chaperone
MNSFNEDPYVMLGLPPGATKKQIKKAYHRCAMRFHPDKNPNDPEAGKKFKQIQWAYERLRQDKRLKNVLTDGAPQQKSSEDSADPFINFFTAMRSHYSKKKESK